MTFALRWVVACTAALAACSPSERSSESAEEPVADSVSTTPGAVARDSGLVFSPDSTMVAFVRTRSDRFIKSDVYTAPAQELWIARRDGADPRRLLEGRESADMQHVLAGFKKLVFSNDGSKVFFLSPAWSTSDALHVVEVASAQERYIASANSLQLLRTGAYSGCLVVSQHRYLVGTGSYDHYWLIAENGDEIGLVGYDNDEHLKGQIEELLSSAADAGSKRSCASRESLRRSPAR